MDYVYGILCDTLKKDKESLKRLYEKEYKDGQKIEEFLYKER